MGKKEKPSAETLGALFGESTKAEHDPIMDLLAGIQFRNASVDRPELARRIRNYVSGQVMNQIERNERTNLVRATQEQDTLRLYRDERERLRRAINILQNQHAQAIIQVAECWFGAENVALAKEEKRNGR
jgi:hypothetical protein